MVKIQGKEGRVTMTDNEAEVGGIYDIGMIVTGGTIEERTEAFFNAVAKIMSVLHGYDEEEAKAAVDKIKSLGVVFSVEDGFRFSMCLTTHKEDLEGVR